MISVIEFGQWLPDQAPLGVPGVVTARNVLPSLRGYLPFPSQSVYSDAMTARAQGGIAVRDKAGTAYTFAGDATKLYQLSASGTTWTDVSRTTPAYATSAEERWEFAKWKETVIATNYADDPQTITLGGSAFSALTTALKARHIAVIGDFVVLGNTNDGTDGAVPFRVRWSAINDPTDWTVSASTLADFQDLSGTGGWVRGITSGTFGVVFQERAISRMQFVGAPVVFSFDEIARGIGTLAPGSIVQLGDDVYFLAQDGFRVVRSGSAVEPIGAGRIDRTFFNELDSGNLHRISGVADPEQQRVFWAYPGSGSSGGTPNKILCYDVTTGQWSFSEQETEILLVSVTGGQTLDSLDSVSSSLDALPASLDSRTWAGGNRVLSCIDTSHRLAQLTGTGLAATLVTQEVELAPGRRAMVRRVRPIVDGGTPTVTAITRDRQTDTPTTRAAVSISADGQAPVRANARYHRFQLDIPGSDFTAALGLEVEFQPVGRR